MEIKKFIDKAFENYEESPELTDFKEELLTNLQDRLKSLEKKGMSRTEALNEIKIEFADINKIADELSLAKKKEVFEAKYMSIRNFITKSRAVIYAILGILTGFCVITSGLNYLSTGKIEGLTVALMLFLAVPLAGFVYMGLTQETATRHPMRPLRATIYTIAAFVLFIGILLIPVMIFYTPKPLVNVFYILIPFFLVSLGFISFLMITEKNYRKAWVLKEEEKYRVWAKKFETSGNAQMFGIMSVGVWILGIGAFVFMLIQKLWIYCWIPLVLATAITMFLLAYYMKKSL